MVLDNILPTEHDPADAIRNMAKEKHMEMTGKMAHAVEDDMHHQADPKVRL